MTAKEYILKQFTQESVDPASFIDNPNNVVEIISDTICGYGNENARGIYTKLKYNKDRNFETAIWSSGCIYTNSADEKHSMMDSVINGTINSFSKIKGYDYFEIGNIVVYTQDGDFVTFTEDEDGQRVIEQANYKVAVYIPFKAKKEEKDG